MAQAKRIFTTSAAPVGCALLALSMLLPFVLRQNAWFEWSNSLWLIERQANAISDLGHPTYFLHTTETGVFYPQFAFYGGSLFAAAGALSLLLGSAWAAFLAVLAIATACAYGGVLWIGRQAGLGWAPASLAALVVPISPYSITNLYGRGAWTEIVATSAIPLALAGGLAVMRGLRPWAGVAALAAATALVAGSHNLTLLWGSIVCGSVGLVVLWALGWEGLRRLSPRRAALGLGAIALGGCLVAWSMIPSALYGRGTRAYADGPSLIGQLAAVDRLDVVLRPYPYAPSAVETADPAAKFQLPVYVLAWVLAAVVSAVVARRGDRADRRLAVGLWGLLVLLVILLVNTALWGHFPPLLTTIQFPFRLHAYAVVVTALLVVVALRLLRDAPRRALWVGGLVVALAIQAVIAQTSAWDAPGGVGRDQIVASRFPPAFADYQRLMYRSVEGAPVERPKASLQFDAARVRDDIARAEVPPASRAPLVTNVIASPLVRIARPWHAAGRDFDGLEVIDGAASREVLAEPASPWPVALATVLSLAAGAVIVSGGALLAVTSWRRRRRGR